jgi:tetratricopeptide (TPR) repeat protein
MSICCNDVESAMPILRVILFLILLFAAALPVAAQDTTISTGEYLQAITVAPELFQAATNAANAGEYDQALVDYSLYLLLNPTLSEGYLSRAEVYRAMGNLEMALRDLNYALDYQATSPQISAGIYAMRAQIHLQREDTDSALADLDASLEIVPTATESRLMRARVQVFQGDFAAALADYDRLIELQPQEATYYTARRNQCAARIGRAGAGRFQSGDRTQPGFRPGIR